jgi:hypothetical protein
METTRTMDQAFETFIPALSPESLRRGEWIAYSANDEGVTMEVSKVTSFRNYGKFSVSWSTRTVGKFSATSAWNKRFSRAFSTEAEAMEYAAVKWGALKTWLAARKAVSK